ncbi:hypothetical protein M404DRAFT_1009275 [Pisolithus tinctorius Marx 270]|uniref:DUF8212 domain-containing protein n=1 Tax=Pisolithus tinctorius Marx 270 TaxID=870435 RepID=A0A0C3I712_PISTI|nr:hypothetical protein M404DRAFT_1009275 [Pisolithus tinctorius Marx 270]
MSWAKGRTSTKEEDKVYALMGLFGVNLPILYGEGETKTFLKLQSEIMKTTDDQSIFAWRSASAESHASDSGLFADTSKCFADCGDVQKIPYDLWSEYCTKHFRSGSVATPLLDVVPSCRGFRAILPVRQRGAGLDTLLACARGPAVWNGSEYIANLDAADTNKADLIQCIHLQQSCHGYERVDKGHLATIGVDDFQKFSLQDIHICASQSFLDAPTRRKWLVNGLLYIIPPSILFLLYQSRKASL